MKTRVIGMTNLEYRNEFLVKVHSLEFEIVNCLRILELEHENLATLILERVFSWERKFSDGSEYEFYGTIVGRVLTQYFVELLEGEVENFQDPVKKKTIFSRLKYIFRGSSGFGDYFELNNTFLQQDDTVFGPLIVALCTKDISSQMEDENFSEDAYLLQLARELVSFAHTEFSAAVIADILNQLDLDTEVQEKIKILSKK